MHRRPRFWMAIRKAKIPSAAEFPLRWTLSVRNAALDLESCFCSGTNSYCKVHSSRNLFWNLCRKHVNRRHNRRFQCQQIGCDQPPFGLRTDLQRHERALHAKDQVWKCQVGPCERTFNRRDNMLRHSRSSHDIWISEFDRHLGRFALSIALWGSCIFRIYACNALGIKIWIYVVVSMMREVHVQIGFCQFYNLLSRGFHLKPA